MPSIGPGVAEIHERDASGACCAIYVTKLADAVHILHVFKKKTQKTAPDDIALAQQRYRQLMRKKS